MAMDKVGTISSMAVDAKTRLIHRLPEEEARRFTLYEEFYML
jgi:hypothetical protein